MGTWWTKGARGYFTGSIKRSDRVRLRRADTAIKISKSVDLKTRGWKKTSRGAIVAWHGTVHKNASGILKKGLVGSTGQRNYPAFFRKGDRGNAIFVGRYPRQAQAYAMNAAVGRSGTPVVLRLSIPQKQFLKFKKDLIDTDAAYTKRANAKWVKAAHFETTPLKPHRTISPRGPLKSVSAGIKIRRGR